MAYLSEAYTDNGVDIYSAADTIYSSVVDASNPQMVVCSILLSSLHTDESTISISIYVDSNLLNGMASTRLSTSPV